MAMTGVYSAVLDAEIAKYIRQGYRLTARSDTSAQLVKPKKFSFIWAIIWLILGLGVGFFIYLAWYLAKKEHAIYLTVDAQGRIRKQ
jgi:hypothetical protein